MNEPLIPEPRPAGADPARALGTVAVLTALVLSGLAACGLTVAQRSAITSAEAALCPELVALTGLPPGFEASACVAVEGATAAIPTSEAAVRAAVSAAPVSPRPVERPVPGHGRYLDRRAVMAVTPNK